MDKIKILKRLVSINTDVELSTLEAVDFVANYLEENKAKIHIIYKDYRNIKDKNRATLIASLGNIEKPGIILSGHLDTTKIPNQEHLWETDPLKIKVKDDRVYGKGTTDMKGGIAVALSQIEKLKIFAQKTPIHFVLTHDEEGVFTAINQLKDNNFYNYFPLNQKGCLVMEPTNMKPVAAHRGNKRITIEVTGKSTHGSIPHLGIDAMYYSFKIYAFAQNLFKKMMREVDNRFEYNKTALNISNFHAGLSDSTIPDKAQFDLSCRYIPNEVIDKFFSRLYAYIRLTSIKMKSKDEKCGVKIIERNHVYPLNAKENSEIMQLTKFSSNEKDSTVVTYGSEAGYFQKMGIDTVICGPGNIICAHKPNEFVTISDLTKFEHFFNNINYFNKIRERGHQRND